MPILAQVEVASGAVTAMRRDLEGSERRVAELEDAMGSLREAHSSLDRQLTASRQRVRELEVQSLTLQHRGRVFCRCAFGGTPIWGFVIPHGISLIAEHRVYVQGLFLRWCRSGFRIRVIRVLIGWQIRNPQNGSGQ